MHSSLHACFIDPTAQGPAAVNPTLSTPPKMPRLSRSLFRPSLQLAKSDPFNNKAGPNPQHHHAQSNRFPSFLCR